MGIIKAGLGAIGGTLSDQWLDCIKAEKMTNETIMTKGVMIKKDKKETAVISDGSVIQVGENQIMLLVDGGKIIDYSAEPGYYTVNNQNAPSLFSGDFQGALSDAYNRFRFGGSSPYSQEVVYINTAEIQNIPFGTANAINYFDEFYNAELYIRAHGYYSVKITNPINFYVEMASKSVSYIGIEEFRKMCLSEFLTSFQTAIGKLSLEGVRISHINAKTSELASQMADILDESWEQRRGMKIVQVGISSISYDDESKSLIDIRNKGAMLGDSEIRTGYVQGSVARGIESAGSNPSGSMAGFMGVNMGNAAGGDVIAASGAINSQAKATPSSTPSSGWTCSKCGQAGNAGNFCTNCGSPKPVVNKCPNCGRDTTPGANFCSGCGQKL